MVPHEAFCRREPSMFLDALRGPFAFHGFSCVPCCSEEFRCVVPGGATSYQNDSHGGESVPQPPPRCHFSGIGIGPYPLPWMQHATDLAQMPNVFLFYFAARQSLRARVLLILCFSGSGGCARERNKIGKKCRISHTNTQSSGTRMSA